LNAKKLEEAGVNLDTPITSRFRNVRLRTWLKLILAEMDLTYMETDDLIVVTTPEDAESQLIIRVYHCRDLLAMPGLKEESRPAAGAGTAGSGRGGMFSVDDSLQQRRATSGGMGGMGGGMIGPGGAAAGSQAPELTDSDALIEMITSIVK